jgi:hypothetical protein
VLNFFDKRGTGGWVTGGHSNNMIGNMIGVITLLLLSKALSMKTPQAQQVCTNAPSEQMPCLKWMCEAPTQASNGPTVVRSATHDEIQAMNSWLTDVSPSIFPKHQQLLAERLAVQKLWADTQISQVSFKLSCFLVM